MNFYKLIVLFLLATWCFAAHSMEAPSNISANRRRPREIVTGELETTYDGWKKKFTILGNGIRPDIDYFVVLSTERWDHISKGNAITNGFSGGHDWAHYSAHHFTQEDIVYFDYDLRAYVVSSDKGDALPDIIQKYQDRRARLVRLHTLFPPGVLSPSFVLDSFIKAYRNSTNDKTADSVATFYTDYQDLKIMGTYSERSGTFHIKTIHPDIDWHYRAEFQGSSETLFPKSRFAQGSFKDGELFWRRELYSPDELQESPYFPRNVRNTFITSHGESSAISPSQFILQERLHRYLEAKYASSDLTLDVIDLFFKDPKNPKVDEYNDLIATLRYFLRAEFAEEEQVNQRTLIQLKISLGRYLENGPKEFHAVFLVDDKTKYDREARSLSPQMGNFAMVLADQMLFIDRWTDLCPTANAKVLRTRIVKTAHNFASAFVRQVLAGSEYLSQFEEGNDRLCFTLSNRGISRNPLFLVLMGRTNFGTHKPLLNISPLIISGMIRPFAIRISPYDPPYEELNFELIRGFI